MSERVLAYVAALDRQYYYPTAEEVRAYAIRPDRRARTWTFTAGLQGVFASLMTSAEDVVEYFVRLGWVMTEIDDEDERVMITDLGLAVSRAMEEQEDAAEDVVEIVLDPDDPLAFSKTIREISAAGPALLVDPYFRIEQLLPILNSTGVTRVLTTEKVGKPNIDALRTAVERFDVDRPFEVRLAEDLHDRYVVPDEGDTRFIGISLSGIGRKMTVMGTLRDASEALRAHYEDRWASGTLVVKRNVEPVDEEASP